MMTCPFCRAEIPDDSHFCDQCGKALMFCPECRKPKRGTICAACGADLVDADTYFGGAGQPAGLALVGEGLSLPLMEGDFGRREGIWPDLGGFQYVSGRHGHIGRHGAQWTIVDYGSTNGTIVNGRDLVKDVPVALEVGDAVEIATYKFVVK